ncbi:Uncharacterized protein QTN25_001924 [Entamoeba marina]
MSISSSTPEYVPFVFGFGDTENGSDYYKKGHDLDGNGISKTRTDTSASVVHFPLESLQSNVNSEEKTVEYPQQNKIKKKKSQEKTNLFDHANPNQRVDDLKRKDTFEESYIEVLETKIRLYNKLDWINNIQPNPDNAALLDIIAKLYNDYCALIEHEVELEMKCIELENDIKTIKTTHQMLNQFSALHKRKTQEYLNGLLTHIETNKKTGE